VPDRPVPRVLRVGCSTSSGLDNVRAVVSGDESSYGELGPEFKRDLWRGIVLSDSFTDVRTGIRLCARDVRRGLAVFERVWIDVVAALERGAKELPAALPGRAREALTAIPRRRTLAEVKKVLSSGRST